MGRLNINNLNVISDKYALKNNDSVYTGGSLLKSLYKGKYYKMSTVIDGRVVGTESINELIAYRLSQQLGLRNVLPVELEYVSIGGVKGYASVTKDFNKNRHTSISFNQYCKLNKISIDEAIKGEFDEQLKDMLLLDFLIINRDRHSSNMEFLLHSNTIEIAPIFDNGLSFVAPYTDNIAAIANFDAMKDVKVNSVFGSSLFEIINKYNLKLTSKVDIDYSELFDGLSDKTNEATLSKIKEIIERRVSYVSLR